MECRFSRRAFLGAGAAAIPSLARAAPTPVTLSRAHIDAVNRRRRVIAQEDPSNFDPDELFGIDFKQWVAYRFTYADEPGSQIDSMWWDFDSGQAALYRSRILEQARHPGLEKWRAQGIDFVQGLINACRQRNIEAFWNHRINEVHDAPTGGLEMKTITPMKKLHPDWVIRSWWWQGLWNLAVPDAREYRLQVLRDLAENYEFDGIQLDFSRHVPCLPPGHQWELREGVTEYVRRARRILLDIEKKRGRPYLLAARVPENLRGCRIDGFDVETWARENLVDIFALGTRSMDVDLAAYRRITADTNIKLQPCLDDHHATDGYKFPPVEFFRGVFSNWWQQGADSVMTFNWSCAPPEVARRMGARPGPISHQQAYHSIGSPESLRYKDKIYAVERRGGYPWAEGYFNRNDFEPLPAVLANEGTPIVLRIAVSDSGEAEAARIKTLAVGLTLYGARPGDRLGVTLNGVDLESPKEDFDWKDPQIFTPKPQPDSGRNVYPINPNQKLVRLTFQIPTRELRPGANHVSVRILDRIPYLPGVNIQIEKLEVALAYA